MIATANATAVKSAARHYRNPQNFEGTSLRYFVDRKTGKHVVVREYTHESPQVWRHDLVERARASWKWAEKMIRLEGFVRLP